MIKLINLIKETVEIGLYDFHHDEWITDQGEADVNFRKLPVKSHTDNTFYHGTPSKNLANTILKTGLIHGSYLAKTPDRARNYGRVVLEINLPDNFKISWGYWTHEFRAVETIDPEFITIYSDDSIEEYND